MGQRQYEADIKKDEVVKPETTETAKEEVVVDAETEAAKTPEPTENGESKDEANANTPE